RVSRGLPLGHAPRRPRRVRALERASRWLASRPGRAYSTGTMITITAKAAGTVREIAEAQNLIGHGLRPRGVGRGCAGFSYDLYFEDKVGDLDEEFESNGVKLYVDPMSYQYLEGTEIDYVEGLHGAGFKFNNPNSKGSCGCGSSFSA